MIYTFIPWSVEKKLGKSYNEFMEILPEGSWAILMDYDCTLLSVNWFNQISYIINNNPSSVFTCMVNKVGNNLQVYKHAPVGNDILLHRKFALMIEKSHFGKITDISNGVDLLSGVMIVISKDIWKKIGKFKEEGILGVDNDLHRKLKSHNISLYRMDGLYCYHWYRGGDRKNKQHLL